MGFKTLSGYSTSFLGLGSQPPVPLLLTVISFWGTLLSHNHHQLSFQLWLLILQLSDTVLEFWDWLWWNPRPGKPGILKSTITVVTHGGQCYKSQQNLYRSVQQLLYGISFLQSCGDVDQSCTDHKHSDHGQMKPIWKKPHGNMMTLSSQHNSYAETLIPEWQDDLCCGLWGVDQTKLWLSWMQLIFYEMSHSMILSGGET